MVVKNKQTNKQKTKKNHNQVKSYTKHAGLISIQDSVSSLNRNVWFFFTIFRLISKLTVLAEIFLLLFQVVLFIF